jgi:hypothetical protein
MTRRTAATEKARRKSGRGSAQVTPEFFEYLFLIQRLPYAVTHAGFPARLYVLPEHVGSHGDDKEELRPALEAIERLPEGSSASGKDSCGRGLL